MSHKLFLSLVSVILIGAGCARGGGQPPAQPPAGGGGGSPPVSSGGQAPSGGGQTARQDARCSALYSASGGLILTSGDLAGVVGGSWEDKGINQDTLRFGRCTFDIVSSGIPPAVVVVQKIEPLEFTQTLAILRGQQEPVAPTDGNEISGVGDAAFLYSVDGGRNVLLDIKKGNTYVAFSCQKPETNIRPTPACDQAQYEALGRIVAGRMR